ncbi:hypothetical protein [Hymenobacter sp. YC55]|uniref:hypothetical protein n=1 Tax=Hymenobacter sp. YC55 TaxID=3034019 RepID=UPI0023F96305|nr:hypothetical protein [Hymenobacter sp. YC55]MDF7810696.1 hypothetical protein [Hymenobacter sp. YC55]
MAIQSIRNFSAAEANLYIRVSYDPEAQGTTPRITHTQEPLNPELPTDTSAIVPGDNLADGAVIIAQYCDLLTPTTGITVVASDQAPYAREIGEPNAAMCAPAPSDCTLELIATVKPGNVVSLAVTKFKGETWYSSTDKVVYSEKLATYTITKETIIYVRDANGCLAQQTVQPYETTGGSGLEIIDTIIVAGEEIAVRYNPAGNTGREVTWSQSPNTNAIPTPLTEAQRGYAEGELIGSATRCEGTTQVRFLATLSPPFATVSTTPNSLECGYVPPKTLQVTAKGTAPAVAGGKGSISATPTGGTAPLTLTVLGTNQTVLATDGQASEFENIDPGTYQVRVTDSASPAKVASTLVVVPAVVVRGCTDRNATNYNANATEDDGSCAYTPQQRTPNFRVPLLNSLRFVLEEITNNCSRFESPDNVLFCEQDRPGQQLRPLYRQKVQYCDAHSVQVHTDFAGVKAEIRRHRTKELVRTIEGEMVQKLTGNSDPLAVQLTAYAGDLTALQVASGSMPLTLRRASRVTLSGAASGSYRVQQSTYNSDGDLQLVLNKTWDGAPSGAVQAVWQLSTVKFNVWEIALDFEGLDEGDYQVDVRGTDTTEGDVVATSEPIWLAEKHENTVVVDYRNKDNAYGMVWTTGIVARLRFPGAFFLPDPAGTSTVHRSSSGAAVLLASTVQRRTILRTGALPDWLHEQLFAALRVDGLTINGRAVLAEGDYKWDRIEGYPLSAGSITVELAGGFGTGNSDDSGLPLGDDNLLQLRRGGFLKLH